MSGWTSVEPAPVSESAALAVLVKAVAAHAANAATVRRASFLRINF
jgi:hypothetical protein